MTPEPKRVLVVSGSTRTGSTNTAFCRTAATCAPAGVEVTVFDGCKSLPQFDPDDDRDPLPETVASMRAAIAAADAVLFCTPEYAGTLPGAFKNLLDWTVGGCDLNDKPVSWVGVAVDERRGGGAHATLATVLGYVSARIVTEACVRVPIGADLVGPDGLADDPAIRDAIASAVAALVNGCGAE
jgi:chromate reductase, NAD(P)H dehydrogenase (quinone)